MASKYQLIIILGIAVFPLFGFSQENASPNTVPESSQEILREVAPPSDENVSLNMPRIGIVDALRMLGQLSGADMVIDPNVNGIIDLFMEDVSVEEAWQSVLDSANLSVSQNGGVLHVKPKTAEPTPVIPREVRVIKLQYISLGKMDLSGGLQNTQAASTRSQGNLFGESESNQTNELDQILQGIFQDAITVFKDVRTNHLILSGPKELLEQAESIIKTLDQPIPQLLIEAQIVQIRSQVMEDLGVDWGGVYTIQNSGDFAIEIDRGGGTANSGNTNGSNSSGNGGTFSSSLTQLNVVLSALVEDGDARILFKPRVVTQNNKRSLYFFRAGNTDSIRFGY